MKVVVDQDLCIGCGTCELMCSQCFQLEDGKAQVVRSECGEDVECDIQDVIDSCPVEAISIPNEGGNNDGDTAGDTDNGEDDKNTESESGESL